MQLSRNYKILKASSIIESVIAISVISICMLSAFTIYLNIINQTKSIQYLNAQHKVNLLTQQTIIAKDYDDNLYTFSSYTIDKKVSLNKKEHTALLTFTVDVGGKKNVYTKLVPYEEK